MTDQTAAERPVATTEPHLRTVPLSHPRLPRLAPAMSLVVAGAVAGVLCILTGAGAVTFVLLGFCLHAVLLTGWSRAVENRRTAADRLMTTLVWSAARCSVSAGRWARRSPSRWSSRCPPARSPST